MKTKNLIGILALSSLLGSIVAAAPLGTAFTYQGKLADNGAPAQGTYDLRFTIYDSAGGGNALAGPQTNSAVGVTNGLFTVTLDFGASVFSGQALWLEIAARTNGTGTFAAFTVRQSLTATPYALYAPNAGTAATANGVAANAVIAGGQVVKSLNGLSDAVTLAAGINVTLVTNGNVLQVSATNNGAGGTALLSYKENGTFANGPVATGINAIAQGEHAQALGNDSVVGGGLDNVAGGAFTTVGGGWSNTAVGGTLWAPIGYATIGGGSQNRAAGEYSVISGGRSNWTFRAYSTVGGGIQNSANGWNGVVAGGNHNSASGNTSTVGGGESNEATSDYTTVGGGNQNKAIGYASIVAGGNINSASGYTSMVGGGELNEATNNHTTVGGGNQNKAYGDASTVAGGNVNTASGAAATVPGGYNNRAIGDYSFAAGQSAVASAQGSIVFADNSGNDFVSAVPNEFAIRASNGLRLQSDVGIHLNATDRPLIVRDWDPFASTALNGKASIGRWGLFMEPGALVLGIPSSDAGYRWMEVARYNADGSREKLFGVGNDGMTTVKAVTITGGADLAEPFAMTGGQIRKGSVVVIDDEHPGQLKLSDQPYDHRVAGIISGANGVNPGIALRQEGALEGGQNVALTGRVYALADAARSPIRPGDLLTTSVTPGYAMKATDPAKSQGAIIGKAMTALPQGQGMVLVLVTLQ